MKRRLVSLLAGTLALMSLATGPVAAINPLPGYNSNCLAGADESRGYVWERNSSSYGTKFTGVKFTINPSTLRPCTNGDPGNKLSKSYILATLQGSVSDGTANLVQIGLGKFDWAQPGNGDPRCYTGGLVGNNWRSDQTTFIWTGYGAATKGSMCQAYWADFDNNGLMDDPIASHTYIFSIQESGTSMGGSWQYCITDTSYSPDRARCAVQVHRGVNTGIIGQAWWGCETGQKANALGTPANGTGVIRMTENAYKRLSDGSWYYTENSNVHAGSTGGVWKTNPDYYDFAQDQVGLGERVWCTTASH